MKNKTKFIIVASALIGLIGAVAGICVAIHRLGCIALFDEEADD